MLIIEKCVLAIWRPFCERTARDIKYKSCGKLHCPLTSICQNQNAINGLDTRAQNIDEVQLRKMAANFKNVAIILKF